MPVAKLFKVFKSSLKSFEALASRILLRVLMNTIIVIYILRWNIKGNTLIII